MTAFARWGWLGGAICALLILANVFCLILLDGGVLNWLAIVMCTASGTFALCTWRDEVRRYGR